MPLTIGYIRTLSLSGKDTTLLFMSDKYSTYSNALDTRFTANFRGKHLGTPPTSEGAAKEYDKAAYSYYGDKVKLMLNFPSLIDLYNEP